MIGELQPFIRFAGGVDRDRNEIPAWVKHRGTSAKPEAFNTIISRIVKRAYGYRAMKYFKLRLHDLQHSGYAFAG